VFESAGTLKTQPPAGGDRPAGVLTSLPLVK